MSHSILQHRRQLLNVGTALTLLTCSGIALAEERDDHGDRVKTATPIEHVIVLIGENRTFDNIMTVRDSPRRRETSGGTAAAVTPVQVQMSFGRPL